MIIFGWGHTSTKEFGPTLPLEYPNCKNEVWLHFFTMRTWFTLFFIPIIPYSSKHLLMCEICSQGMELEGENIERAKKINQFATSFLNEEITQDQYFAHLKEYPLLGN